MSIQPIPPDPNTIERIESVRARHAVTALAPLGDDAAHNRVQLDGLVQVVGRTVGSFADPAARRWLIERLAAEAADIRPVPRPGAWFVITDGTSHESLVLPEAFDAMIFHDRRYYVRPLIQAAATHGEFLLLALSHGSAALYRLSGERMERLTGTGLPDGEEGAAAIADRPRQGTPGAARPAGRMNGHDAAVAARERFLEAVSAALCDDIRLREQYVMIAAVDELTERFRALSRHPHLLPPTVPLDPRQVAEPRLRRAAQDAYEHWRQNETRRVAAALGERPGEATHDPRAVVRAAREGRVDTLIAARHGHLWGRIDGTTHDVTLHGTRQPDSWDLIDAAMRAAWRQGGRIRIADPDDCPTPLLARLRD